ncbi:phospholipase D-like domain-containing protein [Rhodocista pekingensis]|uniref:Phospholipase D n=1 Tax=Rhodocista pekingensis TaxID=201185 RepID=A0ABW2KP87_9PROT
MTLTGTSPRFQPDARAPQADSLLRPGETCWQVARADRIAPIVDAADYFAVLKQALLKARHQVLLIAWDFDTRIRLEPPRREAGQPQKLGRLLSALVRSRPDLRVHVLKWRLSVFQAAARGMVPLFLLDLRSGDRLQYRLASDHPVGACHHQKIVVIDDALAFCGGIDVTADRWDTRAHHDFEHFRRRPGGARYAPFHDVTMAVDGEAARALGQLARDRWESATGDRLPAPPAGCDPWPADLVPLLRDLPVGIARTQPAYGDQPAAHEVEALWLAAIRSARRCLYIEAQYLAGRSIAEALAERLSEPDGPEIVVINPTEAPGWLEEQAMGMARDHILAALRGLDPGGRFGIYTPVTARGRGIFVHSKVLVVDDRLLRIGSSNINNRSMGFDTECDLAVEVPPGGPDSDARRGALLDFRDGLAAEHLGCTVADLRRAMAAAGGSLLAAIEALRQRPGRTLVPLKAGEVGTAESFFVENELLDPERPRWPLQTLLHRIDWSWLNRRRRRASKPG